jgi:hypothetical protein
MIIRLLKAIFFYGDFYYDIKYVSKFKKNQLINKKGFLKKIAIWKAEIGGSQQKIK